MRLRLSSRKLQKQRSNHAAGCQPIDIGFGQSA
jgi:hypothetical protein